MVDPVAAAQKVLADFKYQGHRLYNAGDITPLTNALASMIALNRSLLEPLKDHQSVMLELMTLWADQEAAENRDTVTRTKDYIERQAAALSVERSKPWCPRVGDPVEVVPDFKYGEWVGVPLWVAAVQWDFHCAALNVTVSEVWPPKSNGDYTDGFYLNHPANSDDLRPRALLGEQP